MERRLDKEQWIDAGLRALAAIKRRPANAGRL